MKFIKILASLLLVWMVSSAFTMENKGKGVYIIGVSASFTDSLVYFTDIQFVDSVTLDKNDMLPLRAEYSKQLKNYLEGQQGLNNRTCFIYFNEKKANLQKTIKKMKDKYLNDGKSQLRETGADFKFTRAVED